MSQNSRTPRYVRAVGPRLRILLFFVLSAVALLGANSAYLASITFLEWHQDKTYQNHFYQLMFLGHLGLGFLLLVPFLIFVIGHIRNAANRPNRRAVRAGYVLFGVSLILLISGLALMRVAGFEIRNPSLRNAIYWMHVISPFFAIWLYMLHRLAGPKIRWQAGLSWAVALGIIVTGMVFFHSQDPRKWNVAGPKEGARYFEPSLAKTASGNFIPAETLMMDEYCRECHSDAYEGWFHSAHHFSSFNNEPYLFSITETRQKLFERDGNVKASRWCAGCHDVVPFFSGAFDDPNFDMKDHPTANAGITCTACHAITHINSSKGNADYTIEEPIHYPFAKSENEILKFINRQLIKAKPAFHKKTFLKPLHKRAEFCSTCHKVSLPGELTHYKEWLRGQNHYDSFLLSGVSGGNAKAFYYPQKAETNCNGCHMPLKESNDFGADFFGNDELSIHDHLFPGGNTGLPALRGEDEIVKSQQGILRNSLRVDLFGIREGGRIDGELHAPLNSRKMNSEKALITGQTYLVEVVLRTLTLGHLFTQGTADSNEVWLDVEARANGKTIGRSGALGEFSEVDPWAHFVNVYMLDRDGNRIDRRNAEDIFTALYDNQIAPGAAAVLHYRLKVPADLTVSESSIEMIARLNYRKFDTIYMQHIYGTNYVNALPITEIAKDQIVIPVISKDHKMMMQTSESNSESSSDSSSESNSESGIIDDWERWNDYGIGLFLKKEKGQLRQAEEAFLEVEKQGRPEGAINLARVYIREGRLSEAVDALGRAIQFDPPPPRWTLAWLNALVNKQNGFFDEAILQLKGIIEDEYEEVRERGFDFSKDYEVINELGLTYYAKSTGIRHLPEKQETLRLAIDAFEKTLELDPENETAHHNLGIIFSILEEGEKAMMHRKFHEKYRVDNNARDRVIAIARERNPAAKHAAQPVVIYDLHREDQDF